MKKNLFILTPTEELEEGVQQIGVTPKINMYEKNSSLVIEAEVPGVEKEDIDVRVARDSIKIEGEKKSQKEVDQKDYYLNEVNYGRFSRILTLPKSVDPERTIARFKDGKLLIVLPESEKEEGVYKVDLE